MYRLYLYSTQKSIIMWFLAAKGGLLRVSKLDASQITHCNTDSMNDNGKAIIAYSGLGVNIFSTTILVFCNIYLAEWNLIVFEFKESSSDTTANVHIGMVLFTKIAYFYRV
jgi:hypothetical protein